MARYFKLMVKQRRVRAITPMSAGIVARRHPLLIQFAAGGLLIASFSVVGANAATPITKHSQIRSAPAMTAGFPATLGAYEEDLAPPIGQLEFSGSLELVRESFKNMALGQRQGDDVRTLKQEIQLQLLYHFSEGLSAFAEIKGLAEQELATAVPQRRAEKEVERGEAWLYWQGLLDGHGAVKIGRQNFAEPRRWWWDADFDALRFDYARDSWGLSLGVAEAVTRKSSRERFIDPQDEDVLRWLGHANWKLAPQLHLSGFYLRQRDASPSSLHSLVETARRDEHDANLRWIGLRAAGEFDFSGGALSYWVDVATVTGNETTFEYALSEGGMSRVVSASQQRVRGHATDMGVVWKLATPLMPTWSLMHARGSGDKNLGGDIDRSFRQTGLQDPTQEFRFYGELLRPELSNLAITSALFGFAVTHNSRLTLGYHRFRQVQPAAYLRDARLALAPTGENKDIGQEVSLLAEIRGWENLKLVLAAATFRAGEAFGAAAGKRAKSLFVEFTLEF